MRITVTGQGPEEGVRIWHDGNPYEVLARPWLNKRSRHFEIPAQHTASSLMTILLVPQGDSVRLR